MKNPFLSFLLLLLASMLFTSCQLVGDIFGAGVYTGMFIVVFIIVIIIVVFMRLFRRRN